jgi:hypothetical protein
MNDTMSLVVATAILTAGGLGLYLYKSSDENQYDGNDYDEDGLFSSNFFSSDDDKDNEVIEEDESEVYEPKVVRSRGGKTKRNKKSAGTKRRY